MTSLRHKLAPPGSRREAIGRKIVQRIVVTSRRRGRIVWQRAIQAGRISLAPQLSEKAVRALNDPATSYDVLCLPIIRWDFRFQRPQQLMRQFAEDGHRVFYLSDDFLLARPAAVREIERNVFELRLPADAATRAFQGDLAATEVRRMSDGVARLRQLDSEVVRSSAFRRPFRSEYRLKPELRTASHASEVLRRTIIIVQHPYWASLAEELRRRFGWPIVYDCMDDHAGLCRNAGGARHIPSSGVLEDQLVRTADLTVATSDWLLARVTSRAQRTALVRNGVDYEHFAQVEPASAGCVPSSVGCVLARTPDSASGPTDRVVASNHPTDCDHRAESGVVVGYYGAIAHWFDARLVAELAKLRPNWRFELVGNTFSSDLSPLAGLSNVRLLGELPYANLPRQLAHWHGCIIPFVRNELTEATNPVKVYEMLAAGMPVVAVDLPELRPIARAGLIELADNAGGFAEQMERLLSAQSPASVAARREFARHNTWRARYRELSTAMGPLEDRLRAEPSEAA
ncbi:MAG: glycosyltransferase [Thermoguttaceae bacterium]